MSSTEVEAAPSELARRSSFGLFLLSESVLFTTAIAVRFLIAREAVGPYSQIMGVVTTLLVVASGLAARRARGQSHRGDGAKAGGQLKLGLGVALAAMAAIVLQWIALHNGGARVGAQIVGVYYVLTGFWLLFAAIGAFLMYAARVRMERIGFGPEAAWSIEAGSLFWEFVAAIWLCLWVVLYLV